jgi:2-amino-4-hydroxy-6-hydroxymethyldihydropteridine diphosphokinase
LCAVVGDLEALAFLSVGSNIEPEANVSAMLQLLAHTPGINVTGISTFFRTPALPGPGEGRDPPRPIQDPDFLNGVLEIRTSLPPHRLEGVLREVEDRLGRVRGQDRYGPRTMDPDLLLYALPTGEEDGTHPGPGEGAWAWCSLGPEEQWEHPDVRKRSFVALPLLELAPGLLLPPDGKPLKIVAEAFPGPCGTPENHLTSLLRSRFLPS